LPGPTATDPLHKLRADCNLWINHVLRLLGEAGVDVNRGTSLRDALNKLIDTRVALALALREAERK
jgi:hypothetical protein